MLRVSVPDLHSYKDNTGIGRVLHGLFGALRGNVLPYEVSLRRLPWPIIRNFPRGISGAPSDTDLVLFPKLIGASALHRGFPYKSVAMCHDTGVIHSSLDRQAFNGFSRYLIRRELSHLIFATHVLVPSNFTKTRLVSYMPQLESKVIVANPGVADAYFTTRITKSDARYAMESIVQKPLPGPILLYVGNENPRKNFGFLLGVLHKLRESYPDIVLLKVGAAGYDDNRIQTLAEARTLGLQPGNEFFFIDTLDDETLIKAYMAADVFVSGSLYEGFGLPYIESLAVGVPVVAVRTGILEDGIPGVFIAEPDQNDFVAKIHMVLHERRIDMATVREYIRRQFSWKQYAATFLNMLSVG